MTNSVRKNASLVFVFVTVLVDVIGLGIIIPVIPTLITQLTGEGLSAASEYGGWLMFSYAFMQFFFAPVMGELSDRYGRKPILLIALTGLGIDYVFHALAPTLFWLFVGRVIAGVCGASFTVANAYIADVSKPEDKAKNFGMIGAAFGLGFIIGPVIGGVFAKWGPQVPFLIAAGLSLLNVIYGLIILPESLPPEKRRPFEWKRANPIGSFISLKKYPMLVGMAIAFFLVHMASHAVQSTWSYFTMLKFNWNEADVGYSLAAVGILVAITQVVLVGWFNKRFGQNRTIVIGFLLWGTGLFLFAFADTGWMLYLFIVPYCLGGIAGPTIQGLVSNQVPDNEQGELQGGLTSLMSLTAIAGPPVMTSTFAVFTRTDGELPYFPGAPFILGTVFLLVSLIFIVRTLRRHNVSTDNVEAVAVPSDK